ncbi:B12-binding domain-containing radical SAM protein [Candidatus Omnitrophota bacterium]
MSKVLFIVTDLDLFERFGIMRISSMLKSRGHQVDIARSMRDNLPDKLGEFQPDILAYSTTTGYHQHYLEVNRSLKKDYPALSIFGGPHPTYFPEIIKEQGVDAVCVGEGEFPMLELADALGNGQPIDNIENLIVKTNGGIKQNQTRRLVEDLDQLPFPDRELLYHDNPALKNMRIKSFFTGRGCPYKCTYCFNHAYNQMFKDKGRVIRKRSVDNLIQEILDVQSKFAMKVLWFMDDVFTLGKTGWLDEFSKKYREKVGLPFVCMSRADLVTEQMVKSLSSAGCVGVYMAIEAGNDRIRNQVLKRNLTKQQMIRASQLFHDYGIKIIAENIIGLPSETIAEMLETLKLNIDCKMDLAICSIFNPYPGTELARFAQEQGYFSDDYSKVEHSYYLDSPLNFTKREKRQIRNLRQLFNVVVSFPWLFPLVRLLINLPSNALFRMMAEIWHGFCLRFKIYRHRASVKENLDMARAFLGMGVFKKKWQKKD